MRNCCAKCVGMALVGFAIFVASGSLPSTVFSHKHILSINGLWTAPPTPPSVTGATDQVELEALRKLGTTLVTK